MKATTMAEHPHQTSLDALIRRQMEEQHLGTSQPSIRPVSGMYLWAAIGQELRRAKSAAARSRTLPEADAAALRARERMMGEMAGSAALPPMAAALSTGAAAVA